MHVPSVSLQSKNVFHYEQRQTSRVDQFTLGLHNLTEHVSNMKHHVAFIKLEGDTYYAITAGNGWQVLTPYSDSDFLFKIPELILCGDGPLCHKARCVIGDKFRLKEIQAKKPVPLADLDEGDICLTFSAPLKPDTPVGNLFQGGNMPTVDVGECRIKFHAKLTLDKTILLIKTMEAMYQTSEPLQEGIDSFRRYMRRTPLAKTKELNAELIKQFKSWVMDSSSLSGIDICHKFVNEYVQADEKKLHFRGYSKTREVFHLNRNPGINEILENIRAHQASINESKNPAILKDPDNFPYLYTISFMKGSEKIDEAVMNYLEGEMVHEGKLYWRIAKCWYYVLDDYIKKIDDKFRQILRNHLLPSDDPVGLRVPWDYWEDSKAIKLDEGYYNEQYKEFPNYYVGDKKLTYFESIELADIIYRRDKETYYLYHVKNGFDHVVRDACSQIVNSARLINSERRTHNALTANISKTETYLKQKIDMKNCDTTRKLFLGKRVVFVYGILTSKPGRSSEEEDRRSL